MNAMQCGWCSGYHHPAKVILLSLAIVLTFPVGFLIWFGHWNDNRDRIRNYNPACDPDGDEQ